MQVCGIKGFFRLFLKFNFWKVFLATDICNECKFYGAICYYLFCYRFLKSDLYKEALLAEMSGKSLAPAGAAFDPSDPSSSSSKSGTLGQQQQQQHGAAKDEELDQFISAKDFKDKSLGRKSKSGTDGSSNVSENRRRSLLPLSLIHI